MRLYDTNSSTPAVERSATWSLTQNDHPMTPKASTKMRLDHYPSKPYRSNKQIFRRQLKTNQEEYIPAAVDDTSTTPAVPDRWRPIHNPSRHDEKRIPDFEFFPKGEQRHQIFQTATESTTTNSNGTVENPTARLTTEPFHFDIEIIKSAETCSGTAFEVWEDYISKASSSTLSTRSHVPAEGMCAKQDHNLDFPSLSKELDNAFFSPPCKVIRKRITTNGPCPFFDAFESTHQDASIVEGGIHRALPLSPSTEMDHGRRQGNDGWNNSIFLENTQSKPSAVRYVAEADDIPWVAFTTDSFKPIEQPHQRPQKAKIVVTPLAKPAPTEKASSVRTLKSSAKHVMANFIRQNRHGIPVGKHTTDAFSTSSKNSELDRLNSRHPFKDQAMLEQLQREYASEEVQNAITERAETMQLAPLQPIQIVSLEHQRSSKPTKTPKRSAAIERILKERIQQQTAQHAINDISETKPADNPNSINCVAFDPQNTLQPSRTQRNTKLIEQLLQERSNYSTNTPHTLGKTGGAKPDGLPKPTQTVALDRQSSQSSKPLQNAGLLNQMLQHRNSSGKGPPSFAAPQCSQNYEEQNAQPLKTSQNTAMLGQLLLQKNQQQQQINNAECAPDNIDKCPSDEREGDGHAELMDSEFIKSLNDNPSFAKYERMLKVGLPLPVIKNAMQRDGAAPAPQQTKATSTTTNTSQASNQDPVQRFRIHWDTHTNVRSNTMWAMIGRENHWLAEVAVDEEEVATLFQKDRNPAKQKSNPTISADNHNESTIRIIEPKRANNCGIILARIKLSYREIAAAIDTIDDTALTLEQINGILQFIPTEEEARVLQEHLEIAKNSQPFRIECEKFMAEMLRVENAKQKAEALLFMKRMPICIKELKNDSRLLQKACEETMNSSSLRKILGLILHLGNAVNIAGNRGKEKAAAIQLTSLLKLQQAKTFDRQTSFLEFVARILRRHSPGVLLQYRHELVSLTRAAKVQWPESVAELQALSENLTELRQMALQLAVSSSSLSSSQLLNVAAVVDHDTSRLVPTVDEVRLLQTTSLGRFALDACLRMTSVYAEVDAAKLVFDQLAHYFGEAVPEEAGLNHGSGSGNNPAHILNSLAQFFNDFDVAVERAIESEKAKVARRRELHRRAPKSPTETPTTTTTLPTPTLPVVVAQQNPSSRMTMVPVKARAKARPPPAMVPMSTPTTTESSMQGLQVQLTSRRMSSSKAAF